MIRILFLLFLAGLCIHCSSPRTHSLNIAGLDPINTRKSRLPLTPVAQIRSGQEKPVIRSLIRGGLAQRSGFRLNDLIVTVNNEKVETVLDVTRKLKRVQSGAKIGVKRGDTLQTLSVQFSGTPQLQADYVPNGTTVVRKTSPLIALANGGDVSVYAQASLDPSRKELHLNFILNGNRVIPLSKADLFVYDKGSKKPFAFSHDQIDALGINPRVYSKTIFRADKQDNPIIVYLKVAGNKFLFEFQ